MRPPDPTAKPPGLPIDPKGVEIFRKRLSAHLSALGGGPRTWWFIAPDQLADAVGPLADGDPESIGIVLVESPWKAARRPYHKQKLALVLANLRHFALEQAARGVLVRHVVHDGPYREALAPLAETLGPLRVMRPAERELRADLAPLFTAGLLIEEPHPGWLTHTDDFRAAGGPPWRMDAFYRTVRRRTGVLMRDGKPEGGRFSFDGENRRPWSGTPAAPEPPLYTPDAVTLEVGRLVADRYAHHPGDLDLSRLPATRADARATWRWALEHALPLFGPFEDAMSTRSRGLFHTRVSPLLNLLRLSPAEVLRDVLALDIPLASKEGFVRQVLGWREFVRHVHEATDGFRELPTDSSPRRPHPGDGGFAGWSGSAWRPSAATGLDGGAAPNALDAHARVPPAFWGRPSGLACLDTVVESVWDEGYSHHITRLMVLANLGTLLGVEPRALTDWFWAGYTDAYDWVVEPNVLAMGTFGAGELMTTKPYVCGSAYINKMSDYCGSCAFDPRTNCPVTALYWAFLGRNRERLEGNRRLALPLASQRKRSDDRQRKDRAVADAVAAALQAGERLDPAWLTEQVGCAR